MLWHDDYEEALWDGDTELMEHLAEMQPAPHEDFLLYQEESSMKEVCITTLLCLSSALVSWTQVMC